MHQIYSCSDENIQVFTTVIPSKGSSPARRRVKSPQHLLTKNVVIESDLYKSWPLEPLPQGSDHGDDEEGRRFGRLQTAQPPKVQPAITPTRSVGTPEPKASNLCGNRAYGKSLIPPMARILVKPPAAAEVVATGSENRAVLGRGSKHPKKMKEECPTLPQGAEPSLPLTGSASCGVPGIFRKMWPRHKKKSEYVGATNKAFEAD